MAHLTTLTLDDLANLRTVEFRLERTGRLDGLSIFAKRVFLFALVEYLREIKGSNQVTDDIRDRFKYTVTDNDVDYVMSKVATEFNEYGEFG